MSKNQNRVVFTFFNSFSKLINEEIFVKSLSKKLFKLEDVQILLLDFME